MKHKSLKKSAANQMSLSINATERDLRKPKDYISPMESQVSIAQDGSIDIDAVVAAADKPMSTLDEDARHSGIGMLHTADAEMIENLTKQNSVLKKSKESFLKKNEFKINKLTKKIEKLIKENEHQSL